MLHALGQPTRDAWADAVAPLRRGRAVVTSSGMAAVALVAQLFRPDQLAVVPHDCYGGTYRLFNALHERGVLDVRFVEFGQSETLEAALAERPALVWIETPSNPLLRIVDIAKLARAGRAAGALVVADNTFLSPVWQKPLQLGADVVVHSTTKYLNGHSDMVGGTVVAGSRELHDKLAWWGNCIGVTGAPFDAYLTLRGLRTLHARMRAHGENAAHVASARVASRVPASTTRSALTSRSCSLANSSRDSAPWSASRSRRPAAGTVLLGGAEAVLARRSLGGSKVWSRIRRA